MVEEEEWPQSSRMKDGSLNMSNISALEHTFSNGFTVEAIHLANKFSLVAKYLL